MTTRLQQVYQERITPALKEEFNYANSMQTPKLEKIVINVGTGTKSNYNVDAVVENIAKITGQAPVKTLAKKSISNFKIRDGQTIGVKVTLRGNRMYEFVDRLVNFALPRVQDFRGLKSTSFDGKGNYSMGLKDQLLFPEIKAESSEQLHGLEIVIHTTAEKDEEAYSLLKHLGFPIQERKGKNKNN